MKTNFILSICISLVLVIQGVLFAQYPPRQDMIWARMAPAGSITMDGQLNEPEWAAAESFNLNYGELGLLPTSGWRPEFQEEAITDPIHANIKFLVTSDNQLWLGFTIPDSSVGGTQDWARWDAILMNVRDKLVLDELTKTARSTELFYTWWIAGFPFAASPVVGGGPYFRGNDRYGNNADSTRTPEQIARWDARTIVAGTSNDAGRDQGWTVEMRIAIDSLGYNATQSNGDIIMLNFSIWDCDYVFEGNPLKVNSARAYIQSSWGNTNYANGNPIRVFARPDVTTSSGTLPSVDPEIVLPNNTSFPTPVIDGVLDETVWQGSYKFEMAWDDNTIKSGYPGVGPWTSGHYQPELGGNPRPPILDPSYAKVAMFFQDNYLYLSADINDQLVQGSNEYDKIDGISFIIGDRALSTYNLDNAMVSRILRVNFDASGQPAALDYLQTLVDSGKAEFGVALKGTTTVNNNTDVDEGFTVELKVDLTALGYPADLGDKFIFMGADLFDGDSFEDPLNNYGSRSWWFRENDGGPALVWGYLDPNKPVGVEDEIAGIIPNSIKVYGNYPNPFNPSTKIKYSIPESGIVNIKIYNSLGEEIRSTNIFNNAGSNEFNFSAAGLSSGVYFYKISLDNLASSTNYQSKTGKMILMK
jgi:hypothetical protein